MGVPSEAYRPGIENTGKQTKETLKCLRAFKYAKAGNHCSYCRVVRKHRLPGSNWVSRGQRRPIKSRIQIQPYVIIKYMKYKTDPLEFTLK